jgi:hypothetical protein
MVEIVCRGGPVAEDDDSLVFVCLGEQENMQIMLLVSDRDLDVGLV